MISSVDSEEHDSILERARSLPQALPPRSDLWPKVNRKLDAPNESPWESKRESKRKSRSESRWSTGRLAAAAVVLVGLSSTFTFWLTKANDPPAQLELAASPPVAQFGPWFASGTDIVQTRAEILLNVKNELAELSPETWDIFVSNLKNNEAAREQINTALEGHPDSELLQQLLLSTYTNELTLLTQIGSMTRSAQQRIKL